MQTRKLNLSLIAAHPSPTLFDNMDNTVHLSPSHGEKKQHYLVKISRDSSTQLYYPVTLDNDLNDQQIYIPPSMRHALGGQASQKIEVELIPFKCVPAQDITEIDVLLGSVDTTEAFHIDKFILVRGFFNALAEYPLCLGQDLRMPYFANGEIKVLDISIEKIKGAVRADKEEAIYFLKANSKISMKVSPFASISLTGQDSDILTFDSLTSPDQTPNIDLSLLYDHFDLENVGGHKKEIAQMLRDVFLSRMIPPQLFKAFGVKHAKGLLLYGPPGTGKTLIAKAICEKMAAGRVTVVKGPELKNKYVGESQKNLRDIFEKAKADKEHLHFIIFDEIDSVFPERGSRTGTGVDDDMVTQGLTILDGVESIDNFVLIATTNKIKQIDSAILRSGRIDVKIRIGLPSETDRLDILTKCTATMRESGVLDERVDLAFLAKETKNYSGAELANLVKKASDLWMADYMKTKTTLPVIDRHFYHALAEMSPMFGLDKRVRQFSQQQFVIYNHSLQQIIDDFSVAADMLTKHQHTQHLCWLLAGEAGHGKTSLALCLAKISGASYVKLISPEQLVSLSLEKRIHYLQEEFDNAQYVDFSLIILDELESLLDADAECLRYNNDLRLKLSALLKNLSSCQNKCIVLATTRHHDFLKRIQLLDLFDEAKLIPPVRLNYANIDDCYKTISSICELWHYSVLTGRQAANDSRNIVLSIKDLIFQIKKFISMPEHDLVLELDAFYEFLHPSRVAGTVAPAQETQSMTSLSIFQHGVAR